MANNADLLNSVSADAQSPPIPKGFADIHGSDSSVPFSPQWLLPKLGDNKLGLESGEKRTDPLKALGNLEDLRSSEKKKDVFRPSLYDAGKVRRDCWTDEEREANSAIHRDLQEGEELNDSRKLERWSNSSSRNPSESRHFPSDRWTGSGSREGPYEPRRESKWNSRWGPDDKESESWREKCAGKDGESSYIKGAHYQSIHSKDIKSQGKNTDKDGEHDSRSWRSSSALNRRGEATAYLPTSNKSAYTLSYGRGKGDAGASVFSVDRSRIGTSNVVGGGPIRQFPSGTAADKATGSLTDPPSLRYSRMKLFDIYRTTDLKGYRKAFEGFQEFPSLIQMDHLVPLALTAPLTDELVIMEAIENGEILSSGVSQALKDGSSGNSSVDSGLLALSKSGIGGDAAVVVSGSRDEKTNHVKKDHSFYVESAVYDKSSRVLDKVPSSGYFRQFQEAGLTTEASKLEVMPSSTHDLAKNASRSSDIGCLTRLEGTAIGLSSRCADSSSYIGSNLQWQNPNNIQSDMRMETQIRRQLSNVTEQGQGDLFILREKLSDQKPQQYLSPEHLSLFYKDPQGQIQGPFSGSNLIEWFDAGYFGIDLQVRVTSAPADAPFSMLGDVIPQLRTRVRPPPGFGASRSNDFPEVPNRGKVGGSVGVHLDISDLELTKNAQILGNESKVEAENRFLESLMAGRINSAMPNVYLSEGIQGFSGLTGGRTSIEKENMSDMKYIPQKKSLEQQRLPTSFQKGTDSVSIISKADCLQEIPVPQMFLPQIGEIPHQNLDLLSILQSATNTTPPLIDSPLPLWPNFPEVQAMKSTHGGVDITKDSLGLLPNQQSFQTRIGAPNRLQTQQPSLSNQSSFYGLPSGIIPPEKSVASEFGQEAQMDNFLQQYMLAQNVHSQVPNPTNISQMELLLLMQRQKMEQQQHQLLSHALSGNQLHNRYIDQSFWPLNAEVLNVNAAMECRIPQKHEGAQSYMLNTLDLNDSHVSDVSNNNLHGAEDARIAGGTGHSALDLPTQMTGVATHSNEIDASPLLDLALEISTAEQLVSLTSSLVVSHGFPQTTEAVAITSSNSKDLISSEKDEVSPDFLPSVSEMIHHVKDSLPATSKQAHGETPGPKVINDAELCEVNKSSEKKSRKHKNLQSLKVASSEKSKTIFKSQVEKDMPLKTAGPLMESSEFALDKKTDVDKMKVKEVSSNNLTWNPTPGQKVKSLLEIQLEEQSRMQIQSSSATMPKNMQANVSITSEKKYAADSVHYDSIVKIVSENSEKFESPWTVRNKSQLHDVIAEEDLPKVSGITNEEKITYSPPLLSENERDVGHDFTEAKDTRKARKKAAKNKSITTKTSLPSNSDGLPVSVSTAEKSKPALQPLQNKELLPSPPSVPSFGDFVFWKGDQTSRVTTPVWSTDSVKVQKPAFLKDIFREQDKNTKSGRQQIPLQSPTNVQPNKGNGDSSMGKVSASHPSKDRIVSRIQTGCLASGHQKTGMEDDLFWGPLNQTKQGIRSDFSTIANPNCEKLGENSVKVAYGEGSSKKASNAKLSEHSTTTTSFSPSIKPSLSKGKKDSESKNSDVTDFRNWCEVEWFRLTGTNDTSFLEYCLKQTAAEAEALLWENVSLLEHGKEFVDQFVSHKKFLSSDAIKIAFRGASGSGGTGNADAEAVDGLDCSSKGKKRGKKGKKVSPALLGFNVVSNRIMMGEIQTIED